MYFHTDNAFTIENIAGRLRHAAETGRRVRLDVDDQGVLRVKIGEGIWSPPMASTPDPYRDEPVVKGIKWFVNEEGYPYDYPAEYQAEVFPNDFHQAFDTEEEAEAFALGLAQHESHDLSAFGG